MLKRIGRVTLLQFQAAKLRFSTSADEAAKMARKARSNSGKPAPKKSTQGTFLYFLSSVAFIGASAYGIYDVRNRKDGFLGKLYYGSKLDEIVKYVYKNTYGAYTSILLPSDEKLLPDFVSGPFYGEVPPGHAPPPLLVLDLEKTLVAAVYDGRHGWRHVKRPGYAQLYCILLLLTTSQYFSKYATFLFVNSLFYKSAMFLL